MPLCGDRDEFADKIRYSSGLSMSDFDVLRCIPKEHFSLYNVAGTSE